jgi:hypothetical protein
MTPIYQSKMKVILFKLCHPRWCRTSRLRRCARHTQLDVDSLEVAQKWDRELKRLVHYGLRDGTKIPHPATMHTTSHLAPSSISSSSLEKES